MLENGAAPRADRHPAEVWPEIRERAILQLLGTPEVWPLLGTDWMVVPRDGRWKILSADGLAIDPDEG